MGTVLKKRVSPLSTVTEFWPENHGICKILPVKGMEFFSKHGAWLSGMHDKENQETSAKLSLTAMSWEILSLKTNSQRPGRKARSPPNVLPWLSGALLAISFRELVD